ncbi:MAG: translation initiation factor IF-2 [archaeon]
MAKLRSPICAVVGHVDHGKTSLLDKIRNTSMVSSEPGLITQSIGASLIPLSVINELCGALAKNLNLNVPGLLFIDTPGHAAFTSLRKRGGTLADLAILVVDVNEGFKPQTVEAIEILKAEKTPFIVAANKIDLIPGWEIGDRNVLFSIRSQAESVQQELDKRLYQLVGVIHEHGFASERFDRVDDYTKQIALIPVSARTGEGIPGLLMVLIGLAQRFLEKCLTCDVSGCAKGTVLEVKEEKGLGTTLDVILYDGTLRVNDTIVIGGIDAPVIAKIRALFEPAALAEMRDKKAKYKRVKEVFAATGVRISAPGIENAISGMPLRSCPGERVGEVSEQLQAEIEHVFIETDQKGVILKADTVGSLEAVIKMLREKDIPIRKATVGMITKKDISDAQSNYERDPLTAVIIGFNTGPVSDIRIPPEIKVITGPVIYRLIDDLGKWRDDEKKKLECSELSCLVTPCKFEIMKGYVFRQNNPAVVGVHVLAGTLKTDMPVMKDGRQISTIKSIQADQDSISSADAGKQVAVSLDSVTVGRQINEGDILYSSVSYTDFRKLRELKQYLKKQEIEVLKEIAVIMRQKDSMWGV